MDSFYVNTYGDENPFSYFYNRDNFTGNSWNETASTIHWNSEKEGIWSHPEYVVELIHMKCTYFFNEALTSGNCSWDLVAIPTKIQTHSSGALCRWWVCFGFRQEAEACGQGPSFVSCSSSKANLQQRAGRKGERGEFWIQLVSRLSRSSITINLGYPALTWDQRSFFFNEIFIVQMAHACVNWWGFQKNKQKEGWRGRLIYYLPSVKETHFNSFALQF